LFTNSVTISGPFQTCPKKCSFWDDTLKGRKKLQQQ
jgi:hypothetical protein